jgi:hypothetical protein
MGERDLRRLVRSLLEAAVAGKTAAGQGLALLRKQNSHGIEYILYDPETFARLTNGVPGDELTGLDPTDVIVGYLDVRPHKGDCWDAAEIKFSAAQKGYGPLMYELAMSDFGKIMSDHGAGSSGSARGVWQKYDQRADVKKLPFDDVKNPKTPPKKDDCKMIPDVDGDVVYLNQAYAGKGDVSGKQTLMRAHQAFVGQMTADGYKPGDVELALRMMGDEYFGHRYRENT